VICQGRDGREGCAEDRSASVGSLFITQNLVERRQINTDEGTDPPGILFSLRLVSLLASVCDAGSNCFMKSVCSTETVNLFRQRDIVKRIHQRLDNQ
jgi:hypothetical protein